METERMKMSAALHFREAMRTERPLQIAGAANALHALRAEQAGFRLWENTTDQMKYNRYEEAK